MTALLPVQISIVLPVFNGAQFLEKCVSSAISQSYGQFELLVGDDDSQDDSARIARAFRDERVRYFRRYSNLGLFANLNLLIREAKAPLIRFLCQDDLLEPNCLAEEFAFFSKHPRVGMSFCKTTRIDANGRVLGQCQLNDLPTVIEPDLATRLFFYHGCLPGNLSTVCVRRSLFQELGDFDVSYDVAADYEMWTRICRRYPLGVLHHRLIKLRHHSLQLSHAESSGTAFIDAARRIRATLLHELPPSLRASARSYERRRQGVLEVHYAVSRLLKGRPREFARLVRIIGKREFLIGMIFWTMTLNNRLYRPSPGLSPMAGSGDTQIGKT